MRLQGWRRFVGGTATVVAARQEAEEFVAFVTRQLGRAMVAYLHAWRRHAQSCATSHTQLRFASAVGVERRCAAAIQGLRSTSMARHRARRLLRCGQTAAVRDCLAALRGAAARGALAMQQAASAASHLRKRRLFRAMAQLHRLPAAFSLDRCAAAWWAHRAAGAALRRGTRTLWPWMLRPWMSLLMPYKRWRAPRRRAQCLLSTVRDLCGHRTRL